MQRQRVRRVWALRACLVLFTLLGMVGMHGLPGGMPAATRAMVTPLGHTMAALTTTTAGTSPAMSDRPTGTVVPAGRDTPIHATASSDAAEIEPLTRPVSGCGMDHANCVVVLRDVAHLPPAPAALPAVHGHDRPLVSASPSRLTDPRGPPGVSLVGLCISRT